jgi:hypothetical protein
VALILSILSEQPSNDDLGEIVDAVPVLAGSRALDRPRTGGQVAVQAAAVAGASFVAGAAAVAAVRSRKVRKVARRRRRERTAVGKVVASRSFLVDVHVLGRD